MSDDSHLKRQLIRYRDLLANLSRRNREIFFRESKGSSVNLTQSPFPKSAFKENFGGVFEPLRSLDLRTEDLLKGKELDLHAHFQIEDLEDDESAGKLDRKLEKIRVADDKHQREYGISGAWLLGPFLCWRAPQSEKADLYISPILKVPVDLRLNKKKRHMLVAEDEQLSINPSLRLCLKHKIGAEIPESQSFATTKEAIDFLQEALKKADKTLRISGDIQISLPKIPPRLKILKNEAGEIIERKPVVLEEELSAADLAIYQAVTSTEFMLIDVLYLDQLNASRTVLIN